MAVGGYTSDLIKMLSNLKISHFSARRNVFCSKDVFFVWLEFFSYCHRCSQDLLCSHDRTGSQPQPLEINRNVECIAIEHTDFLFFFGGGKGERLNDTQYDILQSMLLLRRRLMYSSLTFIPLAPVVRV